jgi:hypothetical protein
MLINTDGNVGIGTTSPSSKLNIKGDSKNWSEIQQGTELGTIHLNPGLSNNHFGNAITFGASDTGGGQNAQAGIYVRSDGSYGTKMYLSTTNAYVTGSKTALMIDYNSNIGIGTTSPSEKLSVDGTVLAKKVRVSTEGIDWPDFVFAPNFKLRTLNELEAYIKANQHLPEVPSANEVEENGLDLGKMDATLLQKVEELTLYLIEESKEKDKLKKENQELKAMFLTLKKEVEALKEKNKE